MKVLTPKALREAMSEEMVYNALRESGYIRNLPVYTGGVKEFSEEEKDEISRLPLSLQMDVIWNTLEDAQNKLRNKPEAWRLFYSEECSNSLNVFMPLELAGVDVFVIWARHFQRLFGKAGFNLEMAPSTSDSFKDALAWMDEVDYTLPPMFKVAFVTNRRRFAEGNKLVGKRELYDYVTSTQNDVLGVRDWQKDSDSSVYTVKVRAQRDLYNDDVSSLPFRLVRQIILANNGDDPINW